MEETKRPGVQESESIRKDEVYRENHAPIADFTFGEKVALVFDDMLERSVPFYVEMQRMITEFSTDFAVPGSNVYDLGCSTGTTILGLAPHMGPHVKFVGVDNSHEMLKRCAQKFGETFDAYCARVSRFLFKPKGLGETLHGMAFHWARVVMKEYGTTFAWTTGYSLVVMQNAWLSGEYGFSFPLTVVLCIALGVAVIAFLVSRFLKKREIIRG